MIKKNNSRIQINLLTKSIKNKTRKLINIGNNCVYLDQLYLPVRQEKPLKNNLTTLQHSNIMLFLLIGIFVPI